MKQFEGGTLLIVDDEPDIVETLKKSVNLWGYRSLTAGCYEEALEALAHNPITAVLSDIAMPGKSGVELLKTVRSTGNNIPFVFLSAYGSKEHMLRAIQYGAVHFMEKPFDGEKLKACVHILMDLGRRLQEDPTNTKMINLLRLRIEKVG